MIAYRATLDVSRALVSHLSGLLKAERRRRGTRKGTRRCSTWWQAVFSLAWFRTGGHIPTLGRGFGLSRSTAYRYLDVHDVTAARLLVLDTLRPFLKHMPVLADAAYEGAGRGIHTPVKHLGGGVELDVDIRARNVLLRGLRCLGERGFALLDRRWRALRHISLSPGRVGDIVRAALVLVHFEHSRIT
ncbi:transposase family protein [Sinosporangium siamense]|uniref:DDE Tnp4 domain-containing protein n=1 Tax=Sinosporangium siamense TaxID=1367973 RepID=A0A919RLT9_9ACTN|nr:transposase family protein [Sinosporangium siamense]GII95562.1 hypothetical protein Ssi02_57930 [Sinosporangium siamense]